MMMMMMTTMMMMMMMTLGPLITENQGPTNFAAANFAADPAAPEEPAVADPAAPEEP